MHLSVTVIYARTASQLAASVHKVRTAYIDDHRAAGRCEDRRL